MGAIELGMAVLDHSAPNPVALFPVSKATYASAHLGITVHDSVDPEAFWATLGPSVAAYGSASKAIPLPRTA